jgi:alpha-tubulin suppressor-like RCC1 family protein
MNTVFIRFLFVLVLTTLSNYTFSQGACGFGPGKGCPGTVYDNAFVNSDNNAATIEYDNFVSTFHSTIVRNYQGKFLVWGEQISNDGVANVLSPIEINNVNFPNLLNHEVYKAAAGSNFIDERQFFVLTSNGLYAWGNEDGVVANAITNSAVFQKINTAAISNANTFGLPSTITPAEVKMMVASIANSLSGTLMITTCSGQVWVLSQLGNLRGNNNTGNATTWSRVETGAGVFLDNIVAARVSGSSAMALRSDGTLWTWGLGTYLGNNTANATRNRATQMTAPPGTPKMIGITADATNPVAYFVLMTDGNLYSLGFNGSRQLGDFTVTERRSWVQPRYNAAAPGGTVMNNIRWVAPSESDGRYPAANVINADSVLFAFGANNTRMIGRGAGADADPGIPDGLTATTKITGVVTGGHTTMVTTKCELNFGYVGHRIRGSMGNGSSANITENSFNFATAQVPVCGTAFSSVAIIPSVTGPGGNYCVGQLYDITVIPSGGTLTSNVGDPINLFGNSTIGYQLQFTEIGRAHV